MKLILMRHAKAEPPSNKKDFDRKLSRKGHKQAVSILQSYQSFFGEGFRFAVLCSAAQRTKETFEILSPEISIREQKILKDLYLADSKEILRHINTYKFRSKENEALLVIGHNNGISDLIFDLTGERILLRTSEAVLIQFPFDSSEYISVQTGDLMKHFTPDL